MDNQTGAKELAEYGFKLGMLNRDLKCFNLSGENESTPVTLVHDGEGMKVLDLTELLPKNPRKKEVALMMTDPKSFCMYVNEQKSDSSRIFALFNPGQGDYRFNAIIDWHGVSGEPANWCDHNVTLLLGLSEQFKAWKAINNKMMSQQDFAEFLKDNRLDIIDPNNATIVELVEELEATVNQRCIGRVESNKGKALAFDQDVETKRNGAKVEIPDKITINIPVFLGMDNFNIQCDFKMRTDLGKISFGIRLLAIDRLVRDTVLAAAETIRKETELPVYI